MHRNYLEYKDEIVSLLNNEVITEILFRDSKYFLTLGAHNNILNSENKVKSFFDEFDKIENDMKYEELIRLVGDRRKLIEVFLDHSEESKKFRNKYQLTLRMFKLQSDDHILSMYLDNPILSQSRNDDLLTEVQFSKLKAYLENKGDYNAKIEFFMEIYRTNPDWYGKLLWLYHENKVDFIPKYLPDLAKDLSQIESESEKKEYIIQYVNSTIDINLEKFHINDRCRECSDSAQLNNIRASNKARQPTSTNWDYTGHLDKVQLDIDSTRITARNDDLCEDSEFDGKFEGSDDELDIKFDDIFGGLRGKSVGELLNYNSNIKEDMQDSNEAATSTNCEYLSGMTRLEPARRFLLSCGFDLDTYSRSTTTRNVECNKSLEIASDADSSDDEPGVNFDYLFGKLKDKPVNDFLNYNINRKENVQGGEKFQMRKYQEELAKHGIEKKNVLICSPTGSGKTIVAVKIVQEHLNSNPNGKVAFLVHTKLLVNQQRDQFKNCLQCRITCSRSTKSASIPLAEDLKNADVLILTSDLLKNALEVKNDAKLECVSKFTLIIFDECHKCINDHSYNQIMTHYFKEKRAEFKTPQIIGLTASTGTNNARNVVEALDRLYTLCANLDARIISTVKDYKEELNQVQFEPEEEIIYAGMRSEDNFDKALQKQMKICEEMLRAMYERDFFSKTANIEAIFNIPEDRLHQTYMGFVKKIKSKLYLDCHDNDHNGRESTYAIFTYLDTFARALMINHLFRASDAVEFIKNRLDLENNEHVPIEVEKTLKKFLKKLNKYNDEELLNENPSLKLLKDKIENQIKKNPKSCIIVFARERTYTQIMKNIFSSMSCSIRCEKIIGNKKSSKSCGSKQNERDGILCRFGRGEINVLFATSVAEAGLSNPLCNMVIIYGNVTNEIARLQSRGRLRAPHSKYVVIVPHKLDWQVNKENTNKYRETIMYEAIGKFQEMDEHIINAKIAEYQLKRQIQETNQMSTSGIHFSDQIWSLFCIKCRQLICKSVDMRLIEHTHPVVVNVECFKSMTPFVKDNNHCQIKCQKCCYLIGNRQNYKGRYFPALKIECFLLICEDDNQSCLRENWIKAPFEIKDLTDEELLRFERSHSLAI